MYRRKANSYPKKYMLNEYQNDNLVSKVHVEEFYGKPFKQIVGWDLTNKTSFKCTECGTFPISSAIIEFFKHDILKVKCYDCQGKTKI